MSIGVSTFQPLSFQQANPLLSGLQAAQESIGQSLQNQQANIKNQYLPQTLAQQLQSEQLKNALSQIQLQYAPQMTQADLGLKQSQIGLTNAQTEWMGPEARARIALQAAQAGLTNQQSTYFPYTLGNDVDPVTKMRLGKSLADKLANLTSNNGGLTVQTAPSSAPAPIAAATAETSGIPFRPATNYPTLPGGIPPQAAQQVVQNLQSPPGAGGQKASDMYDALYDLQTKNMMAGFGKNPTMGSAKSGAGGTYTDPTTGKQVTTDTTKNITVDQQAIAAIDRVKPLLDSLSTNLAPSLTLPGQAALRSGQLVNLTGSQDLKKIFGDSSSYANQYAKGQADLKMASESLLKAWGLNVTNESLHTMQEAVKPQFGENPQGYKDRIAATLSQLEENQKQAAGRLKNGTDLDAAAKNTPQTNAPQIQSTKIVRGKAYYLINGQWHQ